MKADKLINWGELSRVLCGSRFTLRKNSIPKKHQKNVADLLKLIDSWLANIK